MSVAKIHIFSCEEAALEVQMLKCVCGCVLGVFVPQSEFQGRQRQVEKGRGR